MKIRTKINLFFVIGFLTVILAGAFSVNYFGGNQLWRINTDLIYKLNEAKANQIRTFLQGEQEVILSLSASTVFRDFLILAEDSKQYSTQKSIVEQRLNRSITSAKQIQELFILDKNGKIVASTQPSNDGLDKSKDEYFVKGKEGVYIKSFYFSEILKSNAYAVSAPILDDKTKELLGVVVARMYPDNLYSAVGIELPNTKTGENFLIDSNYFLISPTRFLDKKNILVRKIETQNAKDCFSKEEIDAIKQGRENVHTDHSILSSYVDYRGVNIIGTHYYIPEAEWCLITKEDTSEALLPAFNLSVIIFIVSLLILLVFAPISNYFSSKIVKNIIILQKGVKLVEAGSFSQGVVIQSKDEIGELSKSFYAMVDAVKKSRAEVDKKVQEQTKEIIEKQQDLEAQQRATLNILEDIEKEKAKTDALLSGIGEGVIATDANMNLIFMNATAENLIGWKVDEVTGKRIYDFLKIVDEKDKPLPEAQRPFSIALSTGKKVVSSTQKSYYYQRRNGEKFPVSISVTPVIMEGKLVGAINVFRDITHEKEIDKAKTEFVSLASHQLRTPLSAINWYSEMLLDGDAGKITKEQRQYLDEIYKSNKRMVDLVNSLLNVSRIDLGTFSIVPEPCDLPSIAKSVLSELVPSIKLKKLKINEKYDENLGKINADLKLTRVILQNLLSNSVKYTPDEGKISISIVKDKNDVLITVADSGYGIPKKDQSRIFEKLFRADNIRERETDGTGLGLYIIKSILEQSGGKIWFESEENKGTTFFVSIPLSGMKAKEGTKGIS